MAQSEAGSSKEKSVAVAESSKGKSVAVYDGPPRKPRILLAACGCVASVKFGILCRKFSEWAEVRAVATNSAMPFIDATSLPNGFKIFHDDTEWQSWTRIGQGVLHIELRRWADMMVIAPLSANTLAKIVGGLCDNLLTCIVRAWDYSKPMFVAPSMNSLMWRNPFTEKHCLAIDDLGMILIPPMRQRSYDGEYEFGAMAEPETIQGTVRFYYMKNILNKGPGEV